MTETFTFKSFDGAEIAVHTLGEGRPTLMLHGFLASAELNWVLPGIAGRIAAAGRKAIMPDLRGHGRSAAPTDLSAWPGDALAADQEALLTHLGVTDYDLVGYSLGARTAVRTLVRGARPGRCALGGMGDSGIMQAGDRAAMFEDSIRNGETAKDPRAGRYIQALMAQRGLKPQAMLGVLASFVVTTEAELRAIPTPTIAVSGVDDEDNGSPERLAALMQDARSLRVPGNHLTAVAEPALAKAFVDFLG
jgi:pimeloyl-ACP methyl ester carboxylesterase